MALPSFLLIGATKCATSSIHAYAQQHPQICLPTGFKETKYFNIAGHPEPYPNPNDAQMRSRRPKTLAEYNAQFQPTSETQVVAEICPSYLADRCAAELIHRELPEVRLAAILRQPARRAFSHYQFFRRLGWEPASSFREALKLEPQRTADGWGPDWEYRAQGHYLEQLQWYFDLVPSDRILVLIYEEFVEDPLGGMRTLFEFMGVDPDVPIDVSGKANEGRGTVHSATMARLLRSKSVLRLVRRMIPGPIRRQIGRSLQQSNQKPIQLDPVHERELMTDYLPSIIALEEALGKDLEVWYQPLGLERPEVTADRQA